MSRVLAVTGTSTDVGKTVVTAALAAVAAKRGLTAAVCKPAQTGVAPGEPGDLAEIERLAGDLSTVECARYPEPLAPETAATRSGLPFLELSDVVAAIADVRDHHDLTLIEGAGGILVRLAPDLTLLDVATAVDAALVVAVNPGLGALNHAELTVAAIRSRGLPIAGLVIGSWPDDPDLAMQCNLDDLPLVTGVPIVGSIPAGSGLLDSRRFRELAPEWFDSPWISKLLADTNAVSDTAPPEGALT